MPKEIAIDPELKKEWEDKLSEFGLGEDMNDPHLVPMEEIETETETETDIDMRRLISRALLGRFARLPEKFRGDILNDVKKRHKLGDSFVEICERAHTLIAKAEELDEMDDAGDKHSSGRKTEDDRSEEDKQAAIDSVDKLIEKFEGLVSSDDEDEEEE